VIDLNLKSVSFFRRRSPGSSFAGQRRKIINIASMLSFQGGIRVPSYTASKSGVLGLTRLLANEWAGQGINVNAIAPGYMATNNTRQLRDDAERSKEILDRIPAGRWGVPDDLQGPVVFLASQAAITSMAIRWRSMAAGWRADNFVTKSYTVTSSAHCIKTLYCMN
jgi:2-deoxy-D-gluconate 3-dehydrogenase